ncbi:hypothetical protein N7470_007751 [Penicillium chermesinum]|nr:hypothetical protein N7470_007751 [Penicillium chermesinum]
MLGKENPSIPLPAMIDPCYHESFLSSYQEHSSHCDQNVSNHFECHDFQKDLQDMFGNQHYPTATEVNPSDVFQMLGTCPDFSVCHEPHLPAPQLIPNALEKPKTDPAADALNCFHPEHHHVHDHEHAHAHFKNPNDLNLNIPRGAHRSHHRCRGHHHIHAHHYSPYSRHSRSSVSSHFLSSPRDTPPPLEGGSSSIMTTPEFSTDDNEIHMCKWTSTIHGIKTPCGATFADAGALQEHLTATHMNTIDGAKGTGYYCCWAGCHRPDDPFSQKSKLQGHFLTHSNYKNFRCSVCGKSFARQATLDRHERSHRGDKPYKCKECGKCFTDSSELSEPPARLDPDMSNANISETHSRTHTGEKPFKCDWPGCTFQTGDSSNMSSHRLTHGERKHKCPYPGCTKSFTRPDQLKRHQRSTHKDASSTLPSPSPSADHFALPYAIEVIHLGDTPPPLLDLPQTLSLFLSYVLLPRLLQLEPQIPGLSPVLSRIIRNAKDLDDGNPPRARPREILLVDRLHDFRAVRPAVAVHALNKDVAPCHGAIPGVVVFPVGASHGGFDAVKEVVAKQGTAGVVGQEEEGTGVLELRGGCEIGVDKVEVSEDEGAWEDGRWAAGVRGSA